MSIAHDIFLSELAAQERRSSLRYPLSRWYVRPVAAWMASRLAFTLVKPLHLTLLAVACSLSASAILVASPQRQWIAAMLVFAAWFFDRADGLLARRQQTVSPRGAWLDANLDELSDVALHIATAGAAAHLTGSALPYTLLVAFLAGKYLLMHGLAFEQQQAEPGAPSGEIPRGWLHRLYHLPANADVRIHLLLVALVTGQLTAELLLIAIYYTFRWLTRYALVIRRLPGAAS